MGEREVGRERSRRGRGRGEGEGGGRERGGRADHDSGTVVVPTKQFPIQFLISHPPPKVVGIKCPTQHHLDGQTLSCEVKALHVCHTYKCTHFQNKQVFFTGIPLERNIGEKENERGREGKKE